MEFEEQNLGQWIRRTEEDERRRMESPTERPTRERRQEIQANRRYLEILLRTSGGCRMAQSVKRCLGGFWLTYTCRSTRTRWHVSQRSYCPTGVGGLEDEERRETGGRELARPLTLLRDDGALAGGRDRSSPATVASVSALE
jgi:hypothetical protein